MKNFNTYIKSLLVVLLILCINSTIKAQRDSSYYYNPFFEIDNPWITTNNSASYQYFKNINLTNIKISYNKQSGDLRSPFDPKLKNTYTVDVFGYRKIGGIAYFGAIQFEGQENRSARWSYLTNRIDDNPYIIGDSIRGDFKKEQFHLRGGLSANLISEKLKYGISVDYISAMTSKNKDPRSLNEFMQITVNPSLIFQVTNNYKIGFSTEIQIGRERLNIAMLAEKDRQVFNFKGLDFKSSYTIVSSVDREYNIYKNTFGLQSQYETSKFMNITAFNFSYLNNKIEDGRVVIKPEFNYSQQFFDILSMSRISFGSFESKIKASYSYHEGVGEQGIFKTKMVGASYDWIKIGENQDYYRRNINAKLEYLVSTNNAYFGIDCQYDDNFEEYYFAPSTFNEAYTNMIVGFKISKSVKISKSNIKALAYISNKYNLYKQNNLINFENAQKLNIENFYDFVVSEVANDEYRYNTIESVMYSLLLRYDIPISRFKVISDMYFIVEYTGVNAGKSLKSNYMNISLGFKL